MFIRSTQLFHHQSSHISRIVNVSLRISSRWLCSQRSYSDIKTNEELLFSGPTVTITPSTAKIKQSLRRGLFDFTDGPTSIQAACPICPSVDSSPPQQPHHKTQTQHKKCLFINKTTGMHMFAMVNCVNEYLESLAFQVM